MKKLMRVVFVLGVIGGIAWVLYRFAPEMMEQCQGMMKDGKTLGDEIAELSAELEGAPGSVASPERHLPGLARRRRNHYPVEGDLLDATKRSGRRVGVEGPFVEEDRHRLAGEVRGEPATGVRVRLGRGGRCRRNPRSPESSPGCQPLP